MPQTVSRIHPNSSRAFRLSLGRPSHRRKQFSHLALAVLLRSWLERVWVGWGEGSPSSIASKATCGETETADSFDRMTFIFYFCLRMSINDMMSISSDMYFTFFPARRKKN